MTPPPATVPPHADTPAPGLKRSLQARHLSMIAIGGSIGTGLFVASGAMVSRAGPGGALLAYVLMGAMVYFLMTSLAELAAYMPVAGSFSTYGSLYVDPGFGFALGWNYWYNWAVTVAVELVAAQLVMQYWFPAVPGVWWSALFLLLVFALNVISVRGFGEAEFWFALIKVLTVLSFVVLGLLMILGVFRGQPSPGLSHLTHGDAPFVGGMPALLGVVMIAGFSFQGTELVGVAAGESVDPARNIPRAVRQVFWRILLFYVLAVGVIGVLLPYTDPNLIKTDLREVGVSPFTLVFERAGLALAAGVMNAVILTAVLSAGNSGLYASTRMLYNLAVEGRAPAVFKRLSGHGVPVPALLATTAMGALCFLSSLGEGQTVYLWLLNLSGMTGFIAWLGIATSHYRFRRGLQVQGIDIAGLLPYQSPFLPWGPFFAFGMCLLVVLGQSFDALHGSGPVPWGDLIATYVGIPVFGAMWWGWRRVHGSRLVPYAEMHFPGALAHHRRPQ